MLLAAWLAIAAPCQGDESLRRIEVERFGITVHVPPGWELIDLAHHERAFVLRLPQDPGSRTGYVACELAVAPSSLEEYRRRHAANDAREQVAPDGPRRRLIENRLEPPSPASDRVVDDRDDSADDNDAVDGGEAGAVGDRAVGDAAAAASTAVAPVDQRLISVWEYQEGDQRWFEARVRVIHAGTLYTFIVGSDEAHWEAYRPDFDDMLASARFSPPRTGVQRMPGGYWMQRDFHFAMKLPEGWLPTFAPHDQVLFFATGDTHEVFSDNLLVLASRLRPLDLERLAGQLEESIPRLDEAAEVAVCRVIPQGEIEALETVIHTRRGPLEITVIERRFSGALRNYEVKFTCLTESFRRNEAQLRDVLDTFRELRGDLPQLDL